MDPHAYTTPAQKHWKKMGLGHHHGFAIPLFSLHSASSCGIGEFPDLLPMIDWAHGVGFDLIQLLPLNDSGPDSSPYSAISAFALNPIHLGLMQLPGIDLKEVQKLQKLTDSQRIQYEKVRKMKEALLYQYYQAHGLSLTSTPEYQTFVQENSWLEGYAIFKAIKESVYWQSWEEWPEPLKNPSQKVLLEKKAAHADRINFHIFSQFLCFEQLKRVKKHADDKGIFLKGDIPILISRESADVWLERDLFETELSAGAPPDMFSRYGQNWDFPIYQWDTHEKDGYRWWKRRLALAAQFYHLYRLDHIVGFYRIWAIPKGRRGMRGEFLPEDANRWIPEGEKRMQMMLEASPLLPIGEDLGAVPSEVRENLYQLGICTTKVMRWERKWNEDQRFIPLDEYIPESMTTVATHDSETLILWWENNIEEAKAFSEMKGWQYTYELTKQHHYEILYDSHHTSSRFHINPLGEYLVHVPGMTWPDTADERINIPGVTSDKNWTYRYRPSIEEIIESDLLEKFLQEILNKKSPLSSGTLTHTRPYYD